ncbi:hypothetical protein JCM17843_28870 [Kordiimonadales bacterium JCM 17843]|nr:hypothetical protein JCM17843_28870 [Kordiimonadales bacterium JCM 17843]
MNGPFNAAFSAMSGTSGLANGTIFSAAFTSAAAGTSPNLAQQIAAQANGALAEMRITQQAASVRISLHPSELGQVNLHLSMREGRTVAHLIVDRPETLELLTGQLRHLERALFDQSGPQSASQSEARIDLSLRDGRTGQDALPQHKDNAPESSDGREGFPDNALLQDSAATGARDGNIWAMNGHADVLL